MRSPDQSPAIRDRPTQQRPSNSPKPPNSPRLLTFIRHWLAGAGQDQLAASFARFVGTDGYDLAGLRTDLARFSFLLGGDDGHQLFGTSEP